MIHLITDPDLAITSMTVSKTDRDVLQRNSVNYSKLVRGLTNKWIKSRNLK